MKSCVLWRRLFGKEDMEKEDSLSRAFGLLLNCELCFVENDFMIGKTRWRKTRWEGTRSDSTVLILSLEYTRVLRRIQLIVGKSTQPILNYVENRYTGVV